MITDTRTTIEALPPLPRQMGSVKVTTQVQHVSMIAYAIPGERARELVPPPFEPAEFLIAGERRALLSIFSFLDRVDSDTAFEQSYYRLHTRLEGEPGCWLLGTSLGSLSAVASRYLWPLPWHLSAMEFQVAYDQAQARYREYRLQTQSQWASTDWELGDTGNQLSDLSTSGSLPWLLLGHSYANYFRRADGQLGLSLIRHAEMNFTRGYLKRGRCDLLQRLGLLTQAELTRPLLVALQHRLICQLEAPVTLGAHASSLIC